MRKDKNTRSKRTSVPNRRPSKGPAQPPVEAQDEFRLQKFLASAGLGSRRQCEEIIRSGRVTVDGEPINNPGVNVDPLKQVIEYDGERLAMCREMCSARAKEQTRLLRISDRQEREREKEMTGEM